MIILVIKTILVMSVIEEAHRMRRIVFVLVSVVALAGVIAYTAPVSGQAAGEAAGRTDGDDGLQIRVGSKK